MERLVYLTIQGLLGLIDSKEKRACNLVSIKIKNEAKNSSKLCISYSTKAAKVTKIELFYC